MRYFPLVIIFVIFPLFLSSQITMTLTGTQPYPVLYTNYLEEANFISVTLRNSTTEEFSLKPYVVITGPKGLLIQSAEPTCMIDLGPNEVLRYDKNNFDEFCLNFKLNFSNIVNESNLSEEEKQALLLGKLLPEGNYSYCISLKNGMNEEPLVVTCLDIDINYPDHPTLTLPFHESTIDGNQNQQINIAWNHIVNDINLREGLTYSVNLISLGDNALGDYQFPSPEQATIAFDDPNTIPYYQVTDIPYPNFLTTLSLSESPDFIDGYFYAIRVTAVNEDYPYPPQYSQSNVIVFLFEQEDISCGADFEALPLYPTHEMTVPFIKFNNVIKMFPYCDAYRKLDYQTYIKENATTAEVHRFSRDINWPKGAVASYEKLNPNSKDPTGYFSSHIALTDFNNPTTYERGKSYFWKALGNIKYKRKLIQFEMEDVSYVVGMPSMIVSSPESGSVIGPGLINLTAIHDKIPSNPLPPFKIMQIINDESQQYAEMVVDEKAIIQISKYRDFREIIHAKASAINTTDLNYFDEDDRTYDLSAFINTVYTPISMDAMLEETGVYHWRVGWLKSPESATNEEQYKLISQEQMYHIMSDSFTIGNEENQTTAVVNTEENAGCLSPCQLPEVVNRQNISETISGGKLNIGKFELEIDEIQKNGISYSGTGTIKIPFIKNIKLEVVFNDIKINTERVIYEGNVTGKQGGNELESLYSYITGQSIELPFGLDTTINDVKITLAYTDISFSPTNAFAEVNFNTEEILSLLYPSNLYPVLSTQICFSPGGFENDLIFHTIDHMLIQPNESGYGFELTGGSNIADTSTMTYFRFDCKGFHSMQLAGAVILSTDVFLKDSGLVGNDVPINEAVRGTFKAKFVKDGMDLMISAVMQDFQFADYLYGWGFKVDTFYVDLSDKTNPPGFAAPEGYSQAFFNNPNTMYTWKGLYMPRIKVLTPKDFANPNRSTFGVSSMIMGDGIYYLRHRAFNIVNEGIIGRMSATVDTIDAVISNIDFRFRLSGKINLPYARNDAFLSYAGTYNSLSDWNFIIKVPTDSLQIDIWKAYMRLYENSYFTIRSDNSSNHLYVKAIVNGHISIDDRLIPANARHGIKNLKLPAIRFENLGYESGEGIIGGAVFGKASPAKFVNGFPIQLDSIALTNHLGNPGLYVEPRITLSGEENGFSGSVGMIFFAEFNNSSPKDFFTGFDMFLSEINIDVAVASCTFQGYLKFIEEESEKGFEGVIDATFPAGIAGKFMAKFINHTSNSNAPYNTAENFNAWYVDALIAFGGNGIPVFSGVNLYGIGGGVWYNMKQDPDFKIQPAELFKEEATSAQQTKNSPIPYSANFGSGIGLKFQGLFGDPSGGDKLNMLLAVKAQFPQNGGPIISLRGDVNVMSKVQDIEENGKVKETKKALWGYAEITYNGQEHFIDAKVVFKAKMTVNEHVILRGSQDDYSVVEAHFHARTAGENYWFLFVGEPDHRGGIDVNLGPLSMSATNYFMMGNGIPSIIPQPDQEFLAMLDEQQEGFTSSGGSVNSILRKEVNFNSSGIAFGNIIKYGTKWDYQPFYLDVQMIMGMDVNFSKDSTRVCQESGMSPGYNNWYATGQLYAGLKGSFGIHIDFWFLEADKELFEGSIATLMRGGLPNPTWMKCRGVLQYEIIGLVRGSHAFEMELGNVCTIGSGNPFGDMDIITDMRPADKTTNVNFMTSPEVGYALPLDEVIELYDETLKKNVQYKIYVSNYYLKSYDGTKNYNPTLVIENDGFTSRFVPQEYFSGNSWYTFRVSVKAKKRILPDGQWLTLKVNNQEWIESDTSSFKTGPKPDSLLTDQIELSYPLLGQRYFLKGETHNNQGFIYLKLPDPNLFFTSNPLTGRTYKYVIDFMPSDGVGNVITENVTIANNQKLSFKVDQLESNTKYVPRIRRIPGNSLEAVSAANFGAAMASSFVRQSEGFSYEIIPAKMVSLSNQSSQDPFIKTMFRFVFKTSLYDNFLQKVQNFEWKPPLLQSAVTQNIIHNIGNHEEDFDVFDINGFSRHSMISNGEASPVALVEAGIHYLKGENMGESQDFSFLNNDNIIQSVEYSICPVCTRYETWKSGLIGSLKTQINLLTQDVPAFQYRMPLNDPDIVSTTYNYVKNALELPQPNNSGIAAITSGVLTSTSGQQAVEKNLKIKILYGTKGNQMNLRNLVNLILINEKAGSLIKANNLSLFNQMTGFINYPPKFEIEVCKSAKVGLVYRIPTVENYLINSRKTKNYKTPGSCDLPDID